MVVTERAGRLVHWAWLALGLTPVGLLAAILFAPGFQDTVAYGGRTAGWATVAEVTGMVSLVAAAPVAGLVLGRRAGREGDEAGAEPARAAGVVLGALVALVAMLVVIHAW